MPVTFGFYQLVLEVSYAILPSRGYSRVLSTTPGYEHAGRCRNTVIDERRIVVLQSTGVISVAINAGKEVQ